MIVAATHAVGAKDAGVVVDCSRGCSDEAGVAHGAEVFGWVEAEGSRIAESAGGNSIPRGPEGLGGVFDEVEVVTLFQCRECVPVGALTVEMNRQDRFDLRASVGEKDLLGRCGGQIEG